MKRRFWFPILASIPITLIGILISLLFVRANYGSEWAFAAAFPYAVLIALQRDFKDGLTGLLFIAPVILQFPVYGLVLGLASLKGKFRFVLIALVVLHLLAVAPLAAHWLRARNMVLTKNATQQIVGREPLERVSHEALVN